MGESLLITLRKIVDDLEAVGDRTDWRDGDETDMVICWRDVKPLVVVLECFGGAFDALTTAIACVKVRQHIYNVEKNYEMSAELESAISELKALRREFTESQRRANDADNE